MSEPTPVAGSTPAGTPPARPAAAAGDGYFHAGRMKVVGLIAAGVVLVGAIGGVLGIAFDPDPVSTDPVVEPGQALGRLDAGAGNSVGGGHLMSRSLVGADDTTSPSPVGTATPTDTTGTPSPTESPTETEGTETASPSPTETTGPVDNGGGEGVTLANGVEIYLPPGWQVDRQDDIQVNLSDGQGNWAYAYSEGGWDPAADAGSIISANLDALLPPENYTQRQVSDVGTINPFGSVVSIAFMDYEALWVDSQGSITLHGQIYAGIRQDGTALIVLVEHAPAEDWVNLGQPVKDIVNLSFTRFAGLG